MRLTCLQVVCDAAGCTRLCRIGSPDLDEEQLRAEARSDGWQLGPPCDYCRPHAAPEPSCASS